MIEAFLYYIFVLSKYLIIIGLGISVVSFILYKFSNQFNLKHINFYGFFSGMSDNAVVMLSSTILKEITLIYCVINVASFKPIFLYIFAIYCFVYAAFSYNVWVFLKEAIIGGVEYLIIYLLTLLSMFLMEVKYTKMVEYYLIALSIMLVVCSIYLFFRNLYYIVAINKNVRRNLINEN